MSTIKKRRISKGQITLLMMAFPCVIAVILFSYLPLLGWIIAFFDYKPGFKIFDVPFVGFKYFEMAFNDPELLLVLRNTLVISFLGILISPSSVIFAIMLTEMRGKVLRKFVQSTTTLPYFISWVLVYAVAYVMFSVGDGMLNKVLFNFHLISSPLNPLANPDIVWFFQTAIAVWKNLGFGAIVYIAAITGIDPEQYDAAAVDGANRLMKIWHVTIPGLIPTFLTLLLLNIGGLLNNGFEQYYLFNNALVQEKIQVLDLYVYRIGIYLNNYPMSTAIGMTKTLVSILLLTTANYLSKKLRDQSIF
ncbi:ABC transporter permease [Paenibacillus eucommiae]|uniref:Aldouronate transport system permease protein n=1 Tax=Paenibacillus eucommiae TaxID=1355755 RepID=A0ABS4ITQ8_9BACL|nr:ABC transporter permease subunit [Paenibacillus eucommiae]MBP1990933.1 putative aldouronate transport system permease protein [Paenibacillus eucommiae]